MGCLQDTGRQYAWELRTQAGITMLVAQLGANNKCQCAGWVPHLQNKDEKSGHFTMYLGD